MDNMKLTRDFILALRPGRIINELIATHILDEPRPSQTFGKYRYWQLTTNGHMWTALPFSTHIEFAWLVLEKLQKRTTIYLHLHEGGCSVSAGFYQSHLVTRENPCLAICLAALLLSLGKP